MKFKAFFLLLFFIFFSFFAYGQLLLNQTQPTIKKIELRGLNLISESQILSIITLQINDELNQNKVINDIKLLYETKSFENIEVKYVKNNFDITLIYQFKEKPQITNIEFQGNLSLNFDELKPELNSTVFSIFSIDNIEADIEKLKAEYLKIGQYKTIISYKIIQKENNKAELVFEIFEQNRVYISEINVQVDGNDKLFYPLDIKRQIQSLEIDCFGWMNQSGNFDVKKINFDLQSIARLYLQRGYIKVFIEKPRIKLIHNREFSKIVVDLNIIEGVQYFVGETSIETQDEDGLIIEEKKLAELPSLKKGDPYDVFQVYRDRLKIDDVYQSRGYAYSFTNVVEDIDEETKTINVTYQITKKSKVYVKLVDTAGNNTTLDRVIRRELSFIDNQLYNGVKLRESRNNLNGLGYFDANGGVRFGRIERADQDVLDYVIGIKEGQTGALNGSLQYSEQNGFGLSLSVSEKNFLGRGQSVSISAELDEKENRNVSIGLSEPYIFDTDFTGAISLFNQLSNDTNFDKNDLGFTLSLSYPFWPRWSSSVAYRFTNTEYKNVNASGLIELDNQTQTQSRSIQNGWNYNSVNHPVLSTSGQFLNLALAFAGGFLGGQEQYGEANLEYRRFHALNKRKSLIFMSRFRSGKLFKTTTQNIPFSKRYFLGGVTSIRGFSNNSIAGATSSYAQANSFSLQDLIDTSDDGRYNYYLQNQGGDIQAIANFELLFPVAREGDNLKGVLFYDLGNVWQTDKQIYEITGAKQDFADLRQGYGVGLRIITPFGVLRLEYGIKTEKRKNESGNEFHFHISGLFQ